MVRILIVVSCLAAIGCRGAQLRSPLALQTPWQLEGVPPGERKQLHDELFGALHEELGALKESLTPQVRSVVTGFLPSLVSEVEKGLPSLLKELGEGDKVGTGMIVAYIVLVNTMHDLGVKSLEVILELLHPHPGRENDESGETADNDRVDKWFEYGNHTLGNRLIRSCGSVRYRRGALPRFI